MNRVHSKSVALAPVRLTIKEKEKQYAEYKRSLKVAKDIIVHDAVLIEINNSPNNSNNHAKTVSNDTITVDKKEVKKVRFQEITEQEKEKLHFSPTKLPKIRGKRTKDLNCRKWFLLLPSR